jgi:acyl-CoA thioesterase-1
MQLLTRVLGLFRYCIRSYEHFRGEVQPARRRNAVTFACLVTATAMYFPTDLVQAQDKPLKIVALGDSLTAGYGLPAGDAFPAKLAAALKTKGIAANIVNAGVSGDTASGGLERLDWAVADDTDAVIVELGANDALRGLDPKVTRKAIDTIVRKLADRQIPVLLCGMLAPPNLGSDYGKKFNSIYTDVAKTYDALLYPFFLDGIVGDSNFNQRDGLHPTAKGVDVIVQKILPAVEQLVARARAKRNS